MIKCLITAEKVTDFLPLFSDFDPQLPPNGGREGGNDMTKYFGYKYLVNWPMIIEIYENPLGYFYCLLHTVRVKYTICNEWSSFYVCISKKTDANCQF